MCSKRDSFASAERDVMRFVKSSFLLELTLPFLSLSPGDGLLHSVVMSLNWEAVKEARNPKNVRNLQATHTLCYKAERKRG